MRYTEDMNRAETIGRIVQRLQEQLENITDDTINDDTMHVITYGANDTEHIQSSARNSRELEQALANIRKHHTIINA